MQSASTSTSRDRDLRVVGGDVSEDREEETVRELHDVRLRDAGDLAPAVRPRVVEGEANDALRRRGGDRLHRDARLERDLLRLKRVHRLDDVRCVLAPGLVLDPRVQILGVLANDDDVDAVVAGAHAGIRLAGAHARVQLEIVAQCDIHGAKAGTDRCRDRPLQRDAVALDRLERRVGKGRPRLVHDVDPGLLEIPVEVHARRFENASRRLGQLGARPVPGDQRDAVGHERGRSYLRTTETPVR